MIAVLAIFGPTASGKSAVAGRIAGWSERIVAADSAQLYEGLPVLTNQSPAALVGIWRLDHEASVAEYQVQAHEAIDTALADGLTPLVVGGAGLYFRAALADLSVPRLPRTALVSAGAPSTRTEGPSAHALLAPSWTRRSGGRAPERPSSRRPCSGARRGRALAGRRPAVVRRHAASDPRRSP